jgi:hypothetical protein
MVNRLVTIERKKIEGHRIYGVIVAQSANLTLLHQEFDFQFDGYMVIRNRDITLCESSESNDYSRRLMKREGLWKATPRWVRNLPLESWSELIAGFIGKVVIIEDEKSEDFSIGPILEARSKHVMIHYFDGCGILKDVEKVAYSRITSMKFGDRYSTIHAKYLTAAGPPTNGAAPTRRLKA